MTLAAPARHALTVRPVRLADAQSLQDFVQALDPTSRRMRFHGAISGCPPALLRRLTEADGVRHVAFVALASGPQGPAIAGEARYVVNAEGDAAEFAICVSEAHRGSGVADELMRQLFNAARAAGIGWLYGDVLAENVRMAGRDSLSRGSTTPGLVSNVGSARSASGRSTANEDSAADWACG